MRGQKAVELYLTGRYSQSPAQLHSTQSTQGEQEQSREEVAAVVDHPLSVALASFSVPAMGAVRRGSTVTVAALAAAVMWAGMAAAAVYEVGDKAGWTIMGNPNYGAWAGSKRFHFGDTVVFTYNKQFHDVLAVSKADYKNCDVTKPIATWSTGKDSVVLNATGHHYFICGFPGHCGIGQKVDIRVATISPSTAPSMAPAPASGSEPAGGGSSGRAAAAAPSPHGNAASTVGCSVAVTLAVSVLSVAAAGLDFM